MIAGQGAFGANAQDIVGPKLRRGGTDELQAVKAELSH